MYEYKELINPSIASINELARDGWRMVGVGVYTNHVGADRVVYFERAVK